MKNYQFVTLVFLILFHLTGISQIEVPFYVKTANYHTKKYEGGINVKAYQDDKIVRNLSSDNKGDVVLYLPIGAKYRIEISKQGKITRFVNVDYSKLTPILIKAIQEQQETIEQLTNRIINLENK